jgi:hypothetical protein
LSELARKDVPEDVRGVEGAGKKRSLAVFIGQFANFLPFPSTSVKTRHDTSLCKVDSVDSGVEERELSSIIRAGPCYYCHTASPFKFVDYNLIMDVTVSKICNMDDKFTHNNFR